MKKFQSYGFGDLTFLIVDVDRWSASLTETVLRTFGVRNCVFASNEADMMEMLLTQRPDVIFMEWRLKSDSGIDLVKKIRNASFESYQHTPIFMLTAMTDMENVSEARDAGVNEFLARPFSPGNLYSRICAMVANPRPFVDCATYKGPDRRRRRMPVPIDRRRKG
ncbi:Response regulator receiver protein [Candidatus Terasakiella magnetica]|uniref:Response regulator receiver protein n=1 Tax=Candidatus Terasakiella magnetica TaxID=1867952 RepID=A0A1C3RFQ3_9PROT|nr:response regulator [Candidatus Terasakiella magnetica]SCA56110.1 Response regulator receiver protein [Candidatus Terasakiella magnetica]